jgi:hypothetical protein
MTTFTSCAQTDPLNMHDAYRLTFTPDKGILSALIPNGTLSDTLSTALQNIFAAGTIDGITCWVNALNSNPYTTGDLAETVDFLVTSSGGQVSDMIAAVLSVANDFSIFSSDDLSSVDVITCERVIGTNAAPPGTPDADNAVYSAAAAAARSASTAAANAAAATSQGSNWLTSLESDVGTAGKYAVIGAGALLAYWLYKQARRIRRAT